MGVFLKTEAGLEHNQFQLKGISSLLEKNIIVYNNPQVKVSFWVVPCKLSKCSQIPVTLENNMPVASLVPIAANISVSSMINQNIRSHNDELKYQNKILTDIQHLFNSTEQL